MRLLPSLEPYSLASLSLAFNIYVIIFSAVGSPCATTVLCQYLDVFARAYTERLVLYLDSYHLASMRHSAPRALYAC